mgnify:CR=1 FL=1
MIPYGRQQIDQQDIDSVVDVLRSDFLTQGPAVPAFEECVANYCKVPYAVAVNSATSALHIACMALEVGPGDVVWTSPISFVGRWTPSVGKLWSMPVARRSALLRMRSISVSCLSVKTPRCVAWYLDLRSCSITRVL